MDAGGHRAGEIRGAGQNGDERDPAREGFSRRNACRIRRDGCRVQNVAAGRLTGCQRAQEKDWDEGGKSHAQAVENQGLRGNDTAAKLGRMEGLHV